MALSLKILLAAMTCSATAFILFLYDQDAPNVIFNNPGCLLRRLSAFEPIESDLEYHHPPIVQYVKLSSGEPSWSLSFMDYMAMLSAYKLVQPEVIVIHSNATIIGKYWDLAQKWKNTSVQLNLVSYYQPQPSMVIQHQADFLKVRGLLTLGGIVSDFDVIIVNGTKLKEMQKMSECVLSQEGDHLNAGFSSCISNSPFVREWLESYYNDYHQHWLYNSAFKPRDILLNNTKICYNVYVVPNIAEEPLHSKAAKMWLKKDGVNWEGKVAAHYFNKRMKQFDETVLEGNHSFGDMLRYITN